MTLWSVVLPLHAVDIDIEVEHQDSSVVLSWRLPAGVSNSETRVFVDWGEGWVEVTEPHVISHQAVGQSDTIQVQVIIGEYNGSTSVSIPPTPTPTLTPTESDSEDDSSLTEVVLLYSTVFGILLVACAVIVIVILILKYIQISRRNTDKGETDSFSQMQ